MGISSSIGQLCGAQLAVHYIKEMKAFVAVAATIAAAEASHYNGYANGYGYARGYGWAGPQGLGAAPLGLRVHPNGAVTPNDEPAVAAAKADHFAAGGGRSLGPIGYAAGPAIAPLAIAAPAIAAPAIAAPAYAGHAIAAPAIAAPAIAGGYGYAAGYGHAIAPIGAGLPTPLDVAGQVYPAAEPYLHDATGEGSPAAEEYVHDASGDAGGDESPAAEPYIHDATGEAYPAAEPYLHIEPIAAIPAIAHPAPIAGPAIGYAGNHGYAAAAPAIAAPAIARGYAGHAIARPAIAIAQHTVATPVTCVAQQTALVGVQRRVASGPVVAGHGIAAGAAYAHQW